LTSSQPSFKFFLVNDRSVIAPPRIYAEEAIVRAHVRAHAEYPMLAYVANYEAHALSPELVAPALCLRRESMAIFQVDELAESYAEFALRILRP
jgi:hypothetical protein